MSRDLSEFELRELCGRLLCGQLDELEAEQLQDKELERELRERLDRCGVELVLRAGELPLCVVRGAGDELPELALACLALCALELEPNTSGRRARLAVRSLWERCGRAGGYSEAYLRRAALGPLEARGLVKVVKPAQRAGDAYVVAGPAFAALDREGLRARVAAIEEAA